MVSVHNDASADATVIDVQAIDRVGLLYRITRALAELDLDIRSAKAHTVGDRAFDAFYVRDRAGAKITDDDAVEEICRAIVHGVAE
jgi:[protein-PII] uridylyltransferase